MKYAALVLFVSLAILSCGKKADSPPNPVTPIKPQPDPVPSYVFTLVDTRWPDRPFVVELPLSNEAGVKSFEKYLTDGKVPTDPEGYAALGIVTGNLEKCEREGHKWSFCLVPSSIEFADMTTEVCDGTFEYVEKNYDEWMSTVKNYCPWDTARMIRKIEKSGDVIFEKT